MTPREAAEWMVEELARVKWLDQSTVANRLRLKNKGLVYSNANGNLGIDPKVLKEFNKLTAGGDVVWSRSSRQWRYRQKWDKPGRMQS